MMVASKNGNGIQHPKKRAFLAAFVELGTITHAARAANIERTTHYKWLRDEAYTAAFAEAQGAATDSLEREAIRRATEGIEEAVYYAGEKVGMVRKYSDVLLIFLLKGANPNKYRERQSIDHTSNGEPLFRTIRGVDPARM